MVNELNAMPNTTASAAVHESNNSSATNVPSANDQKPSDDKNSEASFATLTLVDPSRLSSSSMCGNSIQEDNGELTVSDNFLLVEGVNQTHSN